jgi:transcriptional regulator with AAA-type ATPase domain
MAWFRAKERQLADAIVELVVTNPFAPEWTRREDQVVGRSTPLYRGAYSWVPGQGAWELTPVHSGELSQVDRHNEQLLRSVRERLRAGAAPAAGDQERYLQLALYSLYGDYADAFDAAIITALRHPEQAHPSLAETWKTFQTDFRAFFDFPQVQLPWRDQPEHLFACFYTLRRAMLLIYNRIVGGSPTAARLRVALWQSVFSCDLLAWASGLFAQMHHFPTLITGPSGTGKEAVGLCIGGSQYIPFLPRKGEFEADFRTIFRPVNLAALPGELIESELFGHIKGAFTFAVADREGRLRAKGSYESIFLDEIGELNGALQVKLLRVLQNRTFQRVGSNRDESFPGKFLAATNRDLAAEVHAGRFREDFYYRLCADRIRTPSLAEQLVEAPDDLPILIEYAARRVVGEAHASRLADELSVWVRQHLGTDYPWPGNFRELEQCIRSFVLRRTYEPLVRASQPVSEGPVASLARAIRQRTRSFAEIRRDLFQQVYEACGSYQQAAELLDIDWRTLKAMLTPRP